MLSPYPPTPLKVCHSLRLCTPDSCSLIQGKSVSAVASSALCPLPPVFSHFMAIRPAFTVSSNHPDPEALRIGRVMMSHPILAHTASSAALLSVGTFCLSTYSAYLYSLCFHKGRGGLPKLTVHLSIRVAADTPPPLPHLLASISNRVLPSPIFQRLGQWSLTVTRLPLRSRKLQPG